MRILTTVLLLLSATATTMAATIAVIGTGNVGSALGPAFAAKGHTIIYGSRDPSKESVNELVAKTGNGASATTQPEAAAQADIVILAVPGMLVEEIVKNLGDLSGKIIIDPTNPLRMTDAGIRFAAETSNAELIQQAAPGAYVVKAFNTLNWRFMMDPDASGEPISIPVVGDHDEAKAVVADLITSIGLEPIDVGPLEFAHWVEGMAILLINNSLSSRRAFNFHLRETG